MKPTGSCKWSEPALEGVGSRLPMRSVCSAAAADYRAAGCPFFVTRLQNEQLVLGSAPEDRAPWPVQTLGPRGPEHTGTAHTAHGKSPSGGIQASMALDHPSPSPPRMALCHMTQDKSLVQTSVSSWRRLDLFCETGFTSPLIGEG